MAVSTRVTEMLGIDFPLIMAPMFLVSNAEMIRAAMRSGIAGVFPSLNFRQKQELESTIAELHDFRRKEGGNFGVNLIVQNNALYREHLEVCLSAKVPFFTTSLGNPAEVIEKAHAYRAKVFCDVTNIKHAAKAAASACDGFIAVGQGAGGHAGKFPLQVLVPALRREFPKIPVVAAGAIASAEGMRSVLALGAGAAAVGTRFIATPEAPVSDQYKQAIVKARMHDIVLSEKLSGTPSNVINTEYVKKTGTRLTATRRWLMKMRKTYRNSLMDRGMNRLERSAKGNPYHKIWVAGQSVELISEIAPCGEIIAGWKKEFQDTH